MNLDTVKKAISDGREVKTPRNIRGFFNEGFTNYELYTILHSINLFGKTTFTRNGKPLTRGEEDKFIEEMLQAGWSPP